MWCDYNHSTYLLTHRLESEVLHDARFSQKSLDDQSSIVWFVSPQLAAH